MVDQEMGGRIALRKKKKKKRRFWYGDLEAPRESELGNWKAENWVDLLEKKGCNWTTSERFNLDWFSR
ncbi:hypothetical protein M5K25_011441 [Dendrobium thyrsiflorum]|uniref:Uncharacterized protein n=1 Tax=Dendrobium thyrsiflorum TaxID=117978 RepID=A0ABD0V376_DENTH